VKQRFFRILKFLAYPALYMTCLLLFFYFTFPWNRLKDRLIAEIAIQAQKPRSTIQRVEIDDLDSYWFTGVEAKGVRIYLPPSDDPGGDKDKPTEAVIKVDEVKARLQILPLFLGRLRVNFWARAFNGEIKGSAPIRAANSPVEVQLDNIDLSYVDIIKDTLGIPIKGVATGKLELAAEGGKFNKASGMLDLVINDVSVGDGKSKIKNQIALRKRNWVTWSSRPKPKMVRSRSPNWKPMGPISRLLAMGRSTFVSQPIRRLPISTCVSSLPTLIATRAI
jgi:type II secretion system protein N